MQEKRKWPRVNIRFDITFRSIETDPPAEGSGVTRNVSAGGAFLATSDWGKIKCGQKLALQMTGLSRSDPASGYKRLSAVGTVLRIHPPERWHSKDMPAGVAVRFDEGPRLYL